MAPSPYMRSIPYQNSSLEDVAIQYLPSNKQLIITFYHNGYQFALLCYKVDDQFKPLKITNNLKKDTNDIRCQLVLSLLNDHYQEIYELIAGANPSFQSLVKKEFDYWNRRV